MSYSLVEHKSSGWRGSDAPRGWKNVQRARGEKTSSQTLLPLLVVVCAAGENAKSGCRARFLHVDRAPRVRPACNTHDLL